MGNTKEGAAKAKLKNIEKYGSYEAYKVNMALRASIGGKAPHSVPRGFQAMTYKQRSEAGRKGGLKNGKQKSN